jgi:hypothetical protein
MIHQLQFDPGATIGPVLTPVPPTQEPADRDRSIGDSAPVDDQERQTESIQAEPIQAESSQDEAIHPLAPLSEPASPWILQSVSIDGAGATNYDALVSRRRSASPPLELIGAGVLGATLLSGFAIADSSKQAAEMAPNQTTRLGQPGLRAFSSRTLSKPSIAQAKPTSGQTPLSPEVVRPEITLPPPPVMVSKNLASMSGLPPMPQVAIAPEQSSSYRTGSLAIQPIQAPTLVSVARMSPQIEPTAQPEFSDSEPEPVTPEPIATEPMSPTTISAAPLSFVPLSSGPVSSGPVSSGPVMAAPIAPEAMESNAVVQRSETESLSDASAPDWVLPAENSRPVAQPEGPQPEAAAGLLGTQVAPPAAMTQLDPIQPTVERSVTPQARPPISQSISQPISLQATPPAAIPARLLSQAEAIEVLRALGHPEFAQSGLGQFVRQSLNARDYEAAAQAQNLATVPPFGFVDYANQRIVLPADLTASLPIGSRS